MRRIISLLLIITLVLSCVMCLNITALATNIDDTSVFIKQEGSDWCTYASATNMIRRRALLDGSNSWSSYTDADLRSSARASGGGMSNSFSYAGYGVKAENWKSKTTEQKKSSLISLLSSHPEGVVIYTFDGTYTHAILACNYTNGTFYVNDPAKKKPTGIIKLTEAQFNGSSQDDRIGWIKKVWYISSGAGTGGTYTPTPTPTPTPSTPAGISLSISNVNLDYPNSASQTITVTATGTLPSKYTLELNLGGNINFNWGSSWSGNSINLTLSANQNSSSTTGTIYLKDSSSNSVLTSINFNVNVTKPVVKEYIKVYFDTTGSSTSFASETVEKYGTVRTPYREPNRTGYTFLGWSTNANATMGQYSIDETISVGANDLVLYAIWQKDKTDWSEWDLSVSDDDLYFDENDYDKTVVISVDKQDDSEFYFTLEFNENIDLVLGEEYYDEHGDFCTEVIVSPPQKSLSNERVTIRMRDENHEIVDTTVFYVHYEETKEVSFADRNPSGISVYLNGRKLSFDVQPQIINGRTMVPMRKIFEELGTVVGWNNNTQKAISVKKGDVVSVSIGGQYLNVNGEQKLLDSPPVIISGRTLVPVRAIAESFNCNVEWYDFGASQVVDINMNDTINRMENLSGLLIGYSEYPPFSFYDDNGNLIGFDTELAKYVCDFWGWDCSFIEIPFDMKFNAINSGRIDCYWNGITKTEEREELCTFTNDYVEYTYQTEEDGEWQTWHDVYSVPFRKGDYDTVQLVNIALEEAEKDGTIAYLKYKYGIE